MTTIKLLLLAGLLSPVLAQPVDVTRPPGSRVDLQTATAVADEIIVARIMPPPAASPRGSEGYRYTLTVVAKLKGDAGSEMEAYLDHADPASSSQASSTPDEPHPRTEGECLVFLCKNWGPNALLSAIKLAEPTAANLAQVKGYLAKPEPSPLPESLLSATLDANRIVVAKITGITSAGPDGGPARNLALDVIQSLKGENGGQLKAVWTPVRLLHTEAMPSPAMPPEVGETRLIMLSDDQSGSPTFVIKLAEATPAQLAAVSALVKNRNLTAQIVLPVNLPPGADELKAILRLTNRGEQPVRVCTRGQLWRGDSKGWSSAPFIVGPFFSDTPQLSDYARYVVTLAPGQWLDLPINFAFAEAKTRPVRLTASYNIESDYAKSLDLPPLYTQAPDVMLEK